MISKYDLINYSYRIATLQEPTEEICRLLEGQETERIVELLLILRGWTNVRNPAGFLKRAIQEGWRNDTKPQKLNRKLENAEMRYFMRRGYSEGEAHKKVIEGRD